MAKGVNPGKDWCEMSKIVAHESYDVDVILIHIQNIGFYGELMMIKVKTLVFCENFMSTETFT